MNEVGFDRGTSVDVCRRQILTFKVDPRSVRVKVFHNIGIEMNQKELTKTIELLTLC